MSLRHLIYLLVFILAVAIQWPLWFGKGGVLRMQALEAELASVRAANDRLRAENDAAAAEIESLESGSGAVSERARMRIYMFQARLKTGKRLSKKAAPPRSRQAM